MISITDKHNCCGCSACIQACPKQCISMQSDAEDFLYPKVDLDDCIDCHSCEKVCPYHNKNLEIKVDSLEVYAAINTNESVREKSSSGGIFSLLAENTLREGGVVFGARFTDEWNVEIGYVDGSLTSHLSSVRSLRGSKYVQAKVGNSYIQCEDFLMQGRKVLFSGTPCQISGLKLFLKKEFENLLTVECVCHGVPSPGLWQKYLEEQTKCDKRTIGDIQNINFRDKRSGWQNYSFTIIYKDGKQIHHLHDDNPWERAFIKNIDLRPSCHNCPTKCLQSRADITLGDLWGADQIMPDNNDNKGITLVVCHNSKGHKEFHCVSKNKKELSFDEVARYSQALIHSPKQHIQRKEFFEYVKKDGFIKTVKSFTKDPLMLRLKISVAKIIRG